MSKTILIVDDEPDVLELFSARLLFEGWQIYTALDSSQAISQLGECRPNILLLDLKLGHESGLDVLDHIQSHNLSNNLGIIVFSGVDEHSLKEEAVKRGADVFFSKPCDVDLLVRRIRDF